MTERDAQIVRLLDTRFDNLPEPTRRVNTTAGFVHKAPARVPCEDCLANDRPMYGCETCGGRGYVEEIRARDPYAVEKVQPYGLDVSRHERSRERDAQLARLESQTAPPRSEHDLIEEANLHPYGWEIARRRMYADHDYAALDRALEQLHGFYPDVSPRSPFGMLFLSVRLPDPLRAPPKPKALAVVGKVERFAGPAARDIRDNQIRELADQGLKPEAIAKECHVSIRTVYNVVNQEAA